MKHPKCTHSFEVVAELPPALQPLLKLTRNFRWTWHHRTRELFREIDRKLFEELGHNPVELIRRASKERLAELSTDRVFLSMLTECSEDLDRYLSEPKWFQENYPDNNLLVAYFCAEFGISESLPIYSGGLGVLAGDHLKAASDLGLPLVGVGLLYTKGYFRQILTPDGWQQEYYPAYDFFQMPLTLLRTPDGRADRVEVELPDRMVTCQIWKAEVGRIQLYLLDSNVLENEPSDQTITDTLYGGDEETRLRQELILGVGGMRVLQQLGLRPTVCHMNEGHAAFMSIERIRQMVEETGCDFRTARQINVHGNVFTTHTPVPAGFDVFRPEMVEKYVGKVASQARVAFTDFLKMGRMNPSDINEPFNMALLAMENSNVVNGVSKLHAKVSREMFHPRWPDFPEDEVPIQAVTNGAHVGTWTSAKMTNLFDQYLGKAWRANTHDPEVWKGVQDIPDDELWAIRENQRGDLVRFVRRYLRETGQRKGFGRATFGQVESILDPRILTIGFARRFATYKRGTLMLLDKDRLKELLFHTERPIQIIIAGKSHPRDDGGKKLIQELNHFIEHEGGRSRMVFLEDYDMRVARMLVQGVDVWLNNPRRPMEASGTSGMKAVPNGALNCSILDGWWDEAYEPGLGWAIGGRIDLPDDGQQDWLDSRTLYHLLETEIAPTFYHRIDGAVPLGWVEMIKKSITKLAPQFSSARMVMDYAEKAYLPSHEAFSRLDSSPDRVAEALKWRERIQHSWDSVHIVSVHDNGGVTCSVGNSLRVTAKVDIDGLSSSDIQAQAVIGQVGSGRDLFDASVVDLEFESQEGSIATYAGSFVCDQPGNRGYTVRVVPSHPDVHVPSELPLVKWEEQ